MSERLIARMLAPVARAVGNMMARGTIVMANAATKMQTLQIKLLSGEAKDGIEHFEPYGYTSHPKAGAEHVTLFMGGDRSHGITIVVADRRYRLAGLAEGEVALHDDQGQKVHLTRSGIVVDGGGLPILMQNSPHVTADTAKLTVTGDLEVAGKADVTGNVTSLASVVAGASVTAAVDVTAAAGTISLTGVKSTFNGHTHVENALPGSTDVPTQQI